MLAHWFARSGIGQLVAPDERIAEHPPPDDSDILQFLAPDPNHAPPQPTAAAAAAAPPRSAFQSNGASPQQVQCQHCQKWTTVPLVGSPSSSATPPVASSSTPAAKHRTPGGDGDMATPFMTPSPSNRRHPSSSVFSPINAMDSHVERLVLSAAQATAQSTFSPPPFQKSRDKVFRFCTTVKMDDKLATRLQKILVKDPSLLHSRAVHLGHQAPDGFTPLMAAAYSGCLKSTEILLKMADTYDTNAETSILMERDYHGRTALHLASEFGHIDVVQILLPKYQVGGNSTSSSSSNAVNHYAPVDLTGRTALGRAITSPQPSARKNRGRLEKALYKPGDLSIIGLAKPETERTGKDEDLQLAYGFADMPGMRVTMEDAMCMSRFTFAGKPYWLFGVCDGHGDQGNVSDFVATQVPEVLQSHMGVAQAASAAASATNDDAWNWASIWKGTCLEVDEKLQKTELAGGSTAVFALVSQDFIIVANVGDSRAILIQQSGVTANTAVTSGGTTGLEKSMQQMAIAESSAEGYPATIDEDEPQPQTMATHAEESAESRDAPTPLSATGPIVIALSDDHKPNLPQEEARIQNAGMKVVPITFEDEGQEVTIHKVAKTDSDMLAVSRAFGDFEYKSNTTLPPDEQAVTAVPDIRIHSRNSATDLYMVLACDGVWDVCENDMVKDFVLHQVEVRRDMSETVLPEVGDALLRESLNRGSKDNMTTMVVALSGEAEKIRPVIQGKALDFASL